MKTDRFICKSKYSFDELPPILLIFKFRSLTAFLSCNVNSIIFTVSYKFIDKISKILEIGNPDQDQTD